MKRLLLAMTLLVLTSCTSEPDPPRVQYIQSIPDTVYIVDTLDVHVDTVFVYLEK